ncbi:MAG: murein biosynthesis integral membrane protein MurJ [Candidatus Dojkabacteria bacterium]
MGKILKILKVKDSVAIIAIILLLAKILGFIKFRIIAGLFGIQRELDIFWAAFVIPDTLFNVLIAGSINAAVIPVFSGVLHKDGEHRLVKLFTVTTTVLSALLLLLVALAYIWTPEISLFMATHGFLGDVNLKDVPLLDAEFKSLVDLTRIMLISPFLLSISAIITSFLQVHKRFFVTTIAPLLYNAGFIWGALLLVQKYNMGIRGLAWSVVLGSFLHIAIQLPVLNEFIQKKLNIHTLGIKNGRAAFYLKEVAKMAKLAIPRTLGLIGEQINVVINTIISFSLTSGALSAYRYALSLHLLPVQILGAAIAQVALPEFAELYAKNDISGFKNKYNKAIRQTFYLIMPAVMILVVLRLPIVRLVYGTGEFNWLATVVTSWCLALLGVAVISQAVVAITMRALFATHSNWLPFITTLITVVINIAASYFFTNFFSHYMDWRPIVAQILRQLADGLNGVGGATVGSTVGSFATDLGKWFTTRNHYDAAVGGLALSLSLTFFIEMLLNFAFLQSKVKVHTWKETWYPIVKILLASFAMMLSMYPIYRYMDLWLNTAYTINVIITLGVTVFIGSCVYVILSWVQDIEEFEEMVSIIPRILKKLVGRAPKVTKG